MKKLSIIFVFSGSLFAAQIAPGKPVETVRAQAPGIIKPGVEIVMVYGTNQKTKYSNPLEVDDFKFFAFTRKDGNPMYHNSIYKLDDILGDGIKGKIGMLLLVEGEIDQAELSKNITTYVVNSQKAKIQNHFSPIIEREPMKITLAWSLNQEGESELQSIKDFGYVNYPDRRIELLSG